MDWNSGGEVASGAGFAETANFQHRAFRLEPLGSGQRPDRLADGFVIDMLGFAAFVTDEEYAVMFATRVRIGEIGIRAFDPHRKIVRHEQV